MRASVIFGLAALVVHFLGYISWYVFKDTMNRIQYIQRLRVYWITRDVPSPRGLIKAEMRQTSEPYWFGRGWQYSTGKHTFQVGLLRYRVDSLGSQLSKSSFFDQFTAKQIREWGTRREAQVEAK
jgi:hypothetical protein